MFSVSIVRGTYPLFVCSGEPHLNDLYGLASLVAEVRTREGSSRVLIDMLSVAPVLDDAQRGEIARFAAGKLHGTWVAVVTQRPLRFTPGESTKLAFRTFPDHPAAAAWLQERAGDRPAAPA